MTHTLTTEDGRLIRLAESESAMMDSLFTPSGTDDGYIIKRNRRSVRFWALGQEWVLNRWGVICHVGKTPDGRDFYQHELTFKCGAGRDMAASLAVSGSGCEVDFGDGIKPGWQFK